MNAQDAYDKGREHGANAGEWYFDGNTKDETYAIVLRGIEDGDPAVFDTFPAFSFGEWAGESLIEILGDEVRDADPEDVDAWADAYLNGFSAGAADMIESTARNHATI
jgi:hypothetical protein